MKHKITLELTTAELDRTMQAMENLMACLQEDSAKFDDWDTPRALVPALLDECESNCPTTFARLRRVYLQLHKHWPAGAPKSPHFYEDWEQEAWKRYLRRRDEEEEVAIPIEISA